MPSPNDKFARPDQPDAGGDVSPDAGKVGDDSGAVPEGRFPRLVRESREASEEAKGGERSGDADIPLVRLAQKGDTAAFGALVKRHHRRAMAVSYRLLGNRDDALEVVQDAFLKAFDSLDTLDKPGAFAGWAMRIVSNLSLNFRRGRALRSTGDLGEVGPAVSGNRNAAGEAVGVIHDPQAVAEGHELGEALQQALAQLPDRQRQALVLFTVEGLPQKEIAVELGCSVEAVKWHVFQARKKLKVLLAAVI